MTPEDRTGALLVFTLCVAALTFVIWIEWMSSRDQGLFMLADPLMAADAGVMPWRPTGH